MKKTLKSFMALIFGLFMISATMSLALAAPGSFTLKASTTPTSVTLKWAESANADGYLVQRLQGNWKTVKKLPASTRSYKITGLKPESTYQYRIRAYEGNSYKNSNTVKVTPTVAKVKGLKATTYSYNTVKLQWEKVSGASGYRIEQYNTKTKKWVNVTNVKSKYDYALVKSLKNDSSYKFRVRAYVTVSGKAYYGSVSSAVSIKVAVPTPAVTTKVSYNAIKLSWSEVKNAKGYRIYKYDAAKKKWVTAVKSTTKTSYTFKNLDTGTTYQFRVRAYEYASKKNYWSSYTTVKATPVISKVSGFSAVSATPESVSFSWNAVKGATVYRIFRQTDGKWEKLADIKTNSFTENNLEPGTSYAYRVRAYRIVGGKILDYKTSSTFKISTEKLPEIVKPGQVTSIERVGATANSVSFKWNKTANTEGYNIYRLSGTKWVKVASVKDTSFTEGKLTANTTYSYKVESYRTENGKTITGDMSANFIIKTAEKAEEPSTEPTKPTEPSTKPTEPSTKPTEPSTKPTEPTTKPAIKLTAVKNITKVSSSASSVTFKWDAVKDATGYAVYRKNGSKWEEVISTTATSYTDKGLVSASTYVYKIEAYAIVDGETILAPTSGEFTIKTEKSISKVTNISKVAATMTTVTFKWDAVSGATGYRVFRQINGEWKKIGDTTLSSYIDKGLKSNTTYKYQIQAYVRVDGETQSAGMSDTFSISTEKTAVIKDLKATEIGETEISLSWVCTADVTGYEVYNADTNKLLYTTSSAPFLTIYNLTGGTKYSFKVRYFLDEYGNKTYGEFTDPLVVTTKMGQPTGLKVDSADKTSVTLSWPKNSSADSYTVSYSTDGSSWKTATSTTNSITIKSLTPGTEYRFRYCVTIDGKNSDYSPIVSTMTGADKVTINAVSAGTDSIRISWQAVSGAKYYALQYYSAETQDWQTVPAASKLATTSHTDKVQPFSSYLYRVVPYFEGDKAGNPTPSVVGTTSDITANLDGYKLTLKWNNSAGYQSYKIFAYQKNRGWNLMRDFTDIKTNSVTVYLAPGKIHSLNIAGNYNGINKSVFKIDVEMPKLNLSDTSNESKNAQLLMLAQAINSTKYMTDDVTVDYKSSTNYTIDYLKYTLGLLPVEYSGKEAVQGFFDFISSQDGGEKVSAETTDKIEEKIAFSNGVGKNSEDKNVYLRKMLEPSSDPDNGYLAYIYGSQTPANWSKGFSKIETKEVSGGGYEITAVLKSEKFSETEPAPYHSGIFESIGSLGNSLGEVDVTDATVGTSTIKAKINADGTLASYSVSSPYDANLNMDMQDAGKFMSVKIHINGTASVEYKFTK